MSEKRGQTVSQVVDEADATDPEGIGTPTAAEAADPRAGTILFSFLLVAFGVFWMVAASRIETLVLVGFIRPSFLPFWSAAIMTALSALLFMQSLRARIRGRRSGAVAPAEFPRYALSILLAFASLLIYALILERVHFFLSTWLISAAGLLLTGERSPIRVTVLSALISGVLFGLFVWWLQIPLPGSRYF